MTPDLSILRHLATRTYASAAEIATACWMNTAEVRARLVMLESQRLVAGRSKPGSSGRSLQRVYVVTGEGRRKAGTGDGRSKADA